MLNPQTNFRNVLNKFYILYILSADDTTLHSTYDTFHNTDNTDIRTPLIKNSPSSLPGLHKTKMTVFHIPQIYVSYCKIYILDEKIEDVDDFKFLCIVINKII